MRKNAPDLLKSVNEFFNEVNHSGLLAQLSSEATATTGTSTISSRAASRRTSRFGSVRSGAFFEDASEKSGVDWRRSRPSAIRSQKWDPKAASPGWRPRRDDALTQDTATEMGIADRLNPQQNIFRRGPSTSPR